MAARAPCPTWSWFRVDPAWSFVLVLGIKWLASEIVVVTGSIVCWGNDIRKEQGGYMGKCARAKDVGEGSRYVAKAKKKMSSRDVNSDE